MYKLNFTGRDFIKKVTINKRQGFSLLLMLLSFMACSNDLEEPQKEEAGKNPLFNKADYTISNEVLRVGISNRMGGAVCTMIYDGEEFINDHDHGRQMQVAWIYNDMGEAYNPTEAGGGYDPDEYSTSQLLSVDVGKNTITTSNHPAYWRFYGPPLPYENTSAVTNDIFSKVLTLGYEGDPNVLVFDTKVEISTELTGPAIESMRIEAPTVYSSAKLTKHYLFNPDNDQMTFVPSISNRPNMMNTRINHVTQHNVIPVMASPDGNLALAIYVQETKDFWAYYTWDVPSEDPYNACTKITAFYKHAVRVGKTYYYRAFVVCGSLATVKSSLQQLSRG